METTTTPADVATALHVLVADLSIDDCDADAEILDNADVASFADAGVLTSNDGLVIRLADGSEFQVTIVRSR